MIDLSYSSVCEQIMSWSYTFPVESPSIVWTKNNTKYALNRRLHMESMNIDGYIRLALLCTLLYHLSVITSIYVNIHTTTVLHVHTLQKLIDLLIYFWHPI